MALYMPEKTVTNRLMAGVAASVLVLAAGFSPISVQAQENAKTNVNLPDFTEIVSEAEGSVVNIRTTETVPTRRSMGPGADPSELFRWFFGPDAVPPGYGQKDPHEKPQPNQPKERTVPRGVGSGFIISDDGYILTNNHVVDSADGIFVTMFDGKEYKAEVIGTDPRTDVALIKIEAEDLKPLPIGDSNSLKKGQWVLAIGSPFGLDSTVTSGIVSAINRETGDYLPFIQTDVAVNPGNSGGPLIDLDGKVVGVNSQIVSRSGGFMGISLAIPIDEAMLVVDQLKAHGKVTRGKIGVQITEVQDDVAKALGLKKAHGALVSSVEADGPADKAGVRAGDVITSFDGHEIQHMTDLPRLVGDTKPDSNAKLKVWRKGKNVDLTVTVAELQEAVAGEEPKVQTKKSKTDFLGLTVKALPKDSDIKNGVLVESSESPAANVGIEPGDIILRVNDVDVDSPKQYIAAVKKLSKSRPAVLLISRNQQSQWVVVKPE